MSGHGPLEPTMNADDFPHGLRCMDCGEPITDGSPYSKRLVAMDEDTPVTEIVCVPCGVGCAF